MENVMVYIIILGVHMVQKSASRQFAFWPDYCIASSRRSLPITVRLIAFQKRDWKYIHTYNTCCRSWPLCAIQCLALTRSAIIGIIYKPIQYYNSIMRSCMD